jgi:isoleucyl-tRNA synthetase
MPLMPYTADEAWRMYMGQDKPLYLESFITGEATWAAPNLLQDWDRLLALRAVVNGVIEKEARATGLAGSNSEVKIALTMPQTELELATQYDLAEWCMVASLTVQHGEEMSATVAKADGAKCPRCWTFDHLVQSSGLCPRCDAVMSDTAQAA